MILFMHYLKTKFINYFLTLLRFYISKYHEPSTSKLSKFHDVLLTGLEILALGYGISVFLVDIVRYFQGNGVFVLRVRKKHKKQTL
jgi:hypothetical protein